MEASAIIPGSKIFWSLVFSPLNLMVIVVALIVLLFSYRRARDKLAKRNIPPYIIKIILSLIIIIIVMTPFMVSYLTVDPTIDYGIKLEGTIVEVTFYEHRKVTYNICSISVQLISKDEALDMLKIRTYGTSDPTTDIHMGYYELKDGRKATVIILGKTSNEVIFIDAHDNVTLVGLPGVKDVYDKILQSQSTECTKGSNLLTLVNTQLKSSSVNPCVKFIEPPEYDKNKR